MLRVHLLLLFSSTPFVSFLSVLDCVYVCFGGEEPMPLLSFFLISNIMQTSGGLQITAGWPGPSLYPRTAFTILLAVTGGKSLWGTATSLWQQIAWLASWNSYEVKDSVMKDVCMLGHSSTFPFTYSILASACVIFYHNFFCSSPAFGVVLLRSSHIRALSHGSPTWCRKPLATSQAAKYSSYWML